MKFQTTTVHLRRIFGNRDLDFETIADTLDLELGHLLLLRDGLQQWQGLDNRMCLLLLCLFHQVNHGALCFDCNDEDCIELAQKLGISEYLKQLQASDFSPLKLQQQQIFCFEQGRLYLHKYQQLEKQLEQLVKQRLENYQGRLFTAEQVRQAATQITAELNFAQLELRQVQALTTALLKPFCIISGGPGSGKTTIMSSILRGLLLLGYQPEQIALAAPTGKAAFRMSEALHHTLQNNLKVSRDSDHQLSQKTAQTIHRLLGADAQGKTFRHHADNPLACKVLIVDEVSMVDVFVMQKLLAAVSHNCRVILIGDQFQLPSVNSGAVLADLMPPPEFEQTISQAMYQTLEQALPESYRQAIIEQLKVVKQAKPLLDCLTVLSGSQRCQPQIAKVAEQVRLGNTKVLEQNIIVQLTRQQLPKQQGVFWHQAAADHEHWRDYYCRWIEQQYFNQEYNYQALTEQLNGFDHHQLAQYRQPLQQMFALANSCRILSFVNQGAFGAEQINHRIAAIMADEQTQKHFHGELIMVTKNQAGLGLANGDTGILLNAANQQLRAVFPMASGFFSLSAQLITDFKPAYAITVHKSQGSEFQKVLISLPEDPNHRLLSREILYTAMTRAKNTVLIYGNPAALKQSIKNRNKRQTGLRFWSR